jgi:hypothetical protein
LEEDSGKGDPRKIKRLDSNVADQKNPQIGKKGVLFLITLSDLVVPCTEYGWNTTLEDRDCVKEVVMVSQQWQEKKRV